MSRQGIHDGCFFCIAVKNSYEFIWKIFTITAEVAVIVSKLCYNAEVLYPHSPAVQSTYIH